MMLLVCLLLPCLHSSGKRLEREDKDFRMSAGIDITEAVRNSSAEITFSHGFLKKWAVCADAGIGVGRMIPRPEQEEISHLEEYGNLRKIRCSNLYSTGVGIQYWPVMCYRGPYISSGCRFMSSEGYDIILESGYAFRIWKGISAAVGIRTGLLKDHSGQGLDDMLRIRICWYFGSEGEQTVGL